MLFLIFKRTQKRLKKEAIEEAKRPSCKQYGILEKFEQKLNCNAESVHFKIDLKQGLHLELKRETADTFEEIPFDKRVCIEHKRNLFQMVSIKRAET